MTNKTITIGILDDDNSKISTIKGLLMYHYDFKDLNINEQKDFIKRLREQYKDYNFNFVTLELNEATSKETILSQIYSENIDCLIIDYKLNSRAVTNINNGVHLSQSILKSLQNFPLFIITSYEEELNQNEIFSPIQIIDFFAFSDSDSYAAIIQGKIIETVLSYNKQQRSLENELSNLLKIPYEKRTAQIDSRILEIDSQLERFACGESAIPEKIKKELNQNKFEDILNKLDIIIRKYDNDGK